MFGAAATGEDGYVRNRGVTEPGVDIEDNLAAVVTYERGALLTAWLNAHAPWEGYRVAVNGTEGRLELEVVERAACRPAGRGRPQRPPRRANRGPTRHGAAPRDRLVVQRHWEPAREVPIPDDPSAHGGGDRLLLQDVFRGTGPDPLGRRAGSGTACAVSWSGSQGTGQLSAGSRSGSPTSECPAMPGPVPQS